MKQKLLIILFALPLFVLNPAHSQSKEIVKTVMTNQWITKYKKLKTDLENKAAFIKNMENISEKDLVLIKNSYSETSFLLDTWVNHLVQSLEENKSGNLEQLANGDIAPDLKAELQELFTFYANDFSTKYEDITGQKSNFVVGAPTDQAVTETTSSTENSPSTTIDKDVLMARIKQPLTPSDWNSIY
jgi:hypothetical protein